MPTRPSQTSPRLLSPAHPLRQRYCSSTSHHRLGRCRVTRGPGNTRRLRRAASRSMCRDEERGEQTWDWRFELYMLRRCHYIHRFFKVIAHTQSHVPLLLLRRVRRAMASQPAARIEFDRSGNAQTGLRRQPRAVARLASFFFAPRARSTLDASSFLLPIPSLRSEPTRYYHLCSSLSNTAQCTTASFCASRSKAARATGNAPGRERAASGQTHSSALSSCFTTTLHSDKPVLSSFLLIRNVLQHDGLSR